MLKSVVSKRIVAIACAVVAPLGATACSGEAGGEVENARAGVLDMPLVTVVNGHKYRLKNAAINVSGPTFAWLQSTDDPGETHLSATLQAGTYSAFLVQWSLERDDGTGAFFPVRANLISNSNVDFDIFADAATTISYRFETDGEIVVIGTGALRVEVTVSEVPVACTPFGSDCPSGSWCAPSSLTGKALACISEGTVAIGAPCLAPTECVRDSSCFDLGTGATCLALCPAMAVGQPCSSGGTCAAGGRGYGICKP